MTLGFIVGSLVLIIAPGNYVRAGTEDSFSLSSYLMAVLSPIRVLQELAKYRALWLFVVCFLVFLFSDKAKTKEWCRKRIVILLVLVISVISCSVVFSGYISSTRTLLFSEILSLVLMFDVLSYLFSIIYTNPHTSGLCSCKHRLSTKTVHTIENAVIMVLFVLFIVDAVQAVKETKRQKGNNDKMLSEIYEANGVVALDVPVSAHRMAIVPMFPKWSWEGVAYKLELDSVHVYPYYCQDKYFEPPLRFAENVYVDKVGVYDSQGMVVIRRPEADFMKDFVCRIDYEKPRKWYRHWLDKMRNYQYERSVEVNITEPKDCFEGYCYYLVWMSKENCGNIKCIEVIEKVE